VLIFEKNLYVSYTMIWHGFLEVNRASGGLDDRTAIKSGEQGQSVDDLRPWHAGPALASEN